MSQSETEWGPECLSSQQTRESNGVQRVSHKHCFNIDWHKNYKSVCCSVLPAYERSPVPAISVKPACLEVLANNAEVQGY